jgi:hypothetical protein
MDEKLLLPSILATFEEQEAIIKKQPNENILKLFFLMFITGILIK